jgi:hypothetical protein
MKRQRLIAALTVILALPLQPALAAPRGLTEAEHTGLRCAAAIAMGAGAQARGEGWAKAYPPLGPRGREFFVRLAAQLMDQAGLDQAGVQAAAQAEAADIRRSGGPGPVMPFCLRLLDAQPGLTQPGSAKPAP